MFTPKIIIQDKAFQKISYWIRKAPGEISGLGIVEKRDDAFLITDVMLLPQKNGAAHTDIEPEDVCKLMYERREQPGEIQYWWHSHANMDTFWSGTDKDTMVKLAAGGYFLNTVFNKKGERRSAIMIGRPCLIFLDQVETTVERFLDLQFQASLNEEYDKNIKKEEERVPFSWTPKGGSQSSFNPLPKSKGGRRKPRGFKKNGKFYFVGSGIETTEEEIDIPEHLDFDAYEDDQPLLIDKRTEVGADDDGMGLLQDREEKIEDIMHRYQCDYSTASMMMDSQEDTERGASC